jgi:uncharacterized protein YoaH (UPF0181 family)
VDRPEVRIYEDLVSVLGLNPSSACEDVLTPVSIARSADGAPIERGTVDLSDLQPKAKRLKFWRPVHSDIVQAVPQSSLTGQSTAGSVSGNQTDQTGTSQSSDIHMSGGTTSVPQGGAGDVAGSRLGSDYSSSEILGSPRNVGAVINTERMEDEAVQTATNLSMGVPVEDNPYFAMTQAQQQHALEHAQHIMRMIQAAQSRSSGNASAQVVPPSLGVGDIGSEVPSRRPSITGIDHQTGNVLLERTSMQNAGLDASLGLQRGNVSTTYSSEVLPSPSPDAATPPAAAASSSGVDDALRARLINEAAAHREAQMRSAPIPQQQIPPGFTAPSGKEHW